jgi:hexulose-6-phosphate isomerase
LIDVPFVDGSAIRNEDELAETADAILALADHAQACGVGVCLETSLEPFAFRRLLERIAHPAVRANYDMGNSAALGYHSRTEIETLGPWLATVHVKDRLRGGGSVPLGTGAADLPTVFAGLHRVGYAGPLILQTARGGDELENARANLARVQGWLAQALAGSQEGPRERGYAP